MTATAGAILVAGRILFAAFFLYAADGHIRQHAGRVAYARSAGMPIPYVAGWPSGAWLAAGAVSVGVGLWADLGALMLAAFVVPAGLILHAFWRIEDPGQRQMQQMSFLRNVAFLGASLALFACFAAFGGHLRFVVTAPVVNL